MQMLIRLEEGRFVPATDDFTTLGPDEEPGPDGPVLVPFSRWSALRGALASSSRALGVGLEPADPAEALAPDLARFSLVAIRFPTFRDGRGYSTAVILRTQFGYLGEIRAVGEVGLDQAWNLARCGFNAFETSARPDAFEAAARRFRHVYQASADARRPAFAERAGL